VSVGYAHACIVLADGTARCWGSNANSQLGTSSSGDSSTPAPVQNLTNVKSIAAGYQQTLAVLTDGSVVVWGTRVTAYDSVTSASTTATYPAPSTIQNLSGVRDVATSRSTDRACVIMGDGTVREWGFGTASDRSTTFSGAPQSVAYLSGVTTVAMGASFDCALVAGAVKCWGWGSEQELGNDPSLSNWSGIPVPVAGFSATPSKISAGSYHTCVLLTTGGVQCWGANAAGELSVPTAAEPNGIFSSGNPVTIGSVAGASDVVAGLDTSCIILSGGAMRCWGGDAYGELGDGMSRPYSESAVDVQDLGENVTDASGGLYDNCAILQNGSVKCWGQEISNSAIFDTRAVSVW
jgi:alpha-tubulin suppressor-like RCC1 family protein